MELAVSIHAPTRGATSPKMRCMPAVLFQFTHPRGVRLSTINFSVRGLSSFNSRTHAGCDLANVLIVALQLGFNSRTHAGCDPKRKQRAKRPHSFNSRTHAGCDFAQPITCSRCCSFNSRTHAGCDEELDAYDEMIDVSIHAPTRGATWHK